MYVVTDAPATRRTKRPGRHPHHALTAPFIRTAPPGRHADGQGLYLYVQPSGARSWTQRLVIRGRRRELGLGSVNLVSLAEAREQALANRKLARSGGDPLAGRGVLHDGSGEYDAARVVHVESSLGHGGTAVVAEVEGEPFRKVEREEPRGLSLMMDVNVRLARVARVTAGADGVAFLHVAARFHLDAPGLQVRDDEVPAAVRLVSSTSSNSKRTR